MEKQEFFILQNRWQDTTNTTLVIETSMFLSNMLITYSIWGSYIVYLPYHAANNIWIADVKWIKIY